MNVNIEINILRLGGGMVNLRDMIETRGHLTRYCKNDATRFAENRVVTPNVKIDKIFYINYSFYVLSANFTVINWALGDTNRLAKLLTLTIIVSAQDQS